MAFKSEHQIWREELNPPAKPTLAERVAKWFERDDPKPEPDHFRFVSVAELMGDSDGL